MNVKNRLGPVINITTLGIAYGGSIPDKKLTNDCDYLNKTKEKTLLKLQSWFFKHMSNSQKLKHLYNLYNSTNRPNRSVARKVEIRIYNVF